MNVLRSSMLSLNKRPNSTNTAPPAYVDFFTKKKQRKNKTPSALQLRRFVAAICMMFSLVIALQIALAVSVKRGGFSIGNLTVSRVQFYSSFIPTLFITALVWYWRSLDRAYRRMQPYINMLQGPTAAQNSVLLDMEHMNFPRLLRLSLQTRHYLTLISTTLAFTGIFYHSLASSFFFVKSIPVVFPADTHVNSLDALGLNPQSQDLSSFVAAAGFAEAAAFYGLGNPPFIMGPWAVARFQYPTDISVNSTVTLNTTAIKSDLNCTAPPVEVLLNTPLPSNTTLQVDIAPGCSRTVVLDPALSTNQYAAVPITNCSQFNNGQSAISPEFAPMLFWFYTIGTGTGQILARSVFCELSLSTAAVEVTMDGKTGLLTKLNVIGGISFNGNNITSGPFDGNSLNGLAFDSQNPVLPFNLSNPFIAARAVATQTQIPGAIFKLATDATINPGGFTTQGILSITQSVYTQYLSVVALGNYFVPASEKLVADVTLWPSRLFMNKATVHILSALLIVVSFIEVILYYLYRKRSRNLHLGTRPGFIAHCMSLLPQSDGNGMAPTDNKEVLKRKLDNMWFMLDEDGYIVGMQPQEPDASRSNGTPSISQLQRESLMPKLQQELYQNAGLYSPKSHGFEGDAGSAIERPVPGSRSRTRSPSLYSWRFSRDMPTSPPGQRSGSLYNRPGLHRKGESLDSSSSSFMEPQKHQRQRSVPGWLPPGISTSPTPMNNVSLPPIDDPSNQLDPLSSRDDYGDDKQRMDRL